MSYVCAYLSVQLDKRREEKEFTTHLLSTIHDSQWAGNTQTDSLSASAEKRKVSPHDWWIGLIKSKALRCAWPWRCSRRSHSLIYHFQLLRRLIHKTHAKLIFTNAAAVPNSSSCLTGQLLATAFLQARQTVVLPLLNRNPYNMLEWDFLHATC